MTTDIEQVRVRRGQLMLFPIKPREACHNMGRLNWLSALLYPYSWSIKLVTYTPEGLDPPRGYGRITDRSPSKTDRIFQAVILAALSCTGKESLNNPRYQKYVTVKSG